MKIIGEAVQNELAEVTDHGVAMSKNGNPQVWVKFKFVDIMEASDEEVGITAYLSLSEAAFPYTMEKLTNLGWIGISISNLDRTAEPCDNLVGHTVRISVAMEEYEGKVTPKVSFINHKDYTGGPAKIDPKEAKILDSKLKGKIAAYRAKGK